MVVIFGRYWSYVFVVLLVPYGKGITIILIGITKPEPAEGHLEDWLIKNEPKNKSYVTTERPGAKLAKLNYRLIGSTERYFLVEVELLTGRHHQIRCQLGHIGCPIKGDLKYGAPRSNPDGSICLHAHEIRFEHPVKHSEVHIIAPPPAGWPV